MQPYEHRHFLLPIAETMHLSVTTQGYRRNMPLILMPGAWQSQMLFQPFLATLSSNYYVITFDLRGHGNSSKPLDNDAYSLTHFASDLRQLITFFQLQDQNWGIVGSSTLTSHILHHVLQEHGLSGLTEVYLIGAKRRPSSELLEFLSCNGSSMSTNMLYTLMQQVACYMLPPSHNLNDRFWQAFREAHVVPLACSQALARILQGPRPSLQKDHFEILHESLTLSDLSGSSRLHTSLTHKNTADRMNLSATVSITC
ncbi:alpha/beta fold hydrolase [Ktedonospora formicarum]|uniref:AB hydrolase-1 domain-containing protein n=1 Tax=Ktedonospora formicarum TaxID=2778364 RepID=A0A8J3I4E8_9CHLR|nr:alpha/beta fold hydrolase [Ktedonospora formicarum]GHO49229.1 hypothetical protein KSX_73920 [Ktedonospora formicarum]